MAWNRGWSVVPLTKASEIPPSISTSHEGVAMALDQGRTPHVGDEILGAHPVVGQVIGVVEAEVGHVPGMLEN